MNQKNKKTRIYSTILVVVLLSVSIGLHAQVGSYTVDGNLNISATTTTKIDLVDLSGAGTGHDRIASTGNLTLNGILELKLEGYVPANADDFKIMDFGGTLNGTFSSIVWPAGMSSWSIDYGVLNPGKVTISGPDSPLPVELTKFQVEVQAGYNLLTWQTATEINNERFDIEYSTDGRSFQTLRTIEGAGFSNEIIDYTYRHLISSTSTYYYRIQQIDLDGNNAYSEIRVASREESSNKLQLFPNPTSGIIQFTQPVHSVNIYDATGRHIRHIKQAGEQIDLSDLYNGTYFLGLDGSTTQHIITLNK